MTIITLIESESSLMERSFSSPHRFDPLEATILEKNS